jgi:hypothetical protein
MAMLVITKWYRICRSTAAGSFDRRSTETCCWQKQPFLVLTNPSLAEVSAILKPRSFQEEHLTLHDWTSQQLDM